MKHISYLSKLFYQFMHNQTKHKEKKHFCMYCLQQFSSLEVLNKHKTNCMVINGKQAIEMPKKGKNIFRYADFEAITEKVQGCQPKIINYSPNHIKSIQIVFMITRLFVFMMKNIVNQFKYIEVKMLFISS